MNELLEALRPIETATKVIEHASKQPIVCGHMADKYTIQMSRGDLRDIYTAVLNAKSEYDELLRMAGQRQEPIHGGEKVNKYQREFPVWDATGWMSMKTLDVYDVLEMYGVTCPAIQHAIKKLLCAGQRGSKDEITDLQEASESIDRSIEMAQLRIDVATHVQPRYEEAK